MEMMIQPPEKGMSFSYPQDQYWAKDDPESLVRHLILKRTQFYQFVDRSELFRKIFRVWQYYHNLYHFGFDLGDMEIQVAGEEGELQLLSINHLRALAHLLVTYTTQSRPAWDTIASNSDWRALRQTRLGNQILDYYFEVKHVEEHLRRSAEHAMVMTTGYTRCTWDETKGQDLRGEVIRDQMGNPTGTDLYKSGDLAFSNPSILDVVYDLQVQDRRMRSWNLVRCPINKWNLIAQYPEYQEEILMASNESPPVIDLLRLGHRGAGPSPGDADMVDYWEFEHVPSLAMPKGRRLCFVGDVPLVDEDYEFEELSCHPLFPSEILLTPFGYTPCFDLLGPQEAVNMVYSSMVTNVNNYGQQKIWLRTGSAVNIADLDAGCTVIQSREKPEPLNLLALPEKIREVADLFVQQMEYLSGINSVSRGQPEASLRSGDALAIVDAKAMQFASQFIANYYQHLSEVGTASLKILQKRAMTPRVMAIAGVNGRSEIKSFQAQDLDQIDMVRVVPGHPIMRTVSGRAFLAQQLMQAQLVTKEEYYTVLTTGELKPLTRSIESELSILHNENEYLLSEDPATPMPEPQLYDNHILHIKEHLALLDSLELRLHPIVAPRIFAHVKQHRIQMLSPEAQEMAMILGYMPAPPAMPGAPGAQGGPPGPPALANPGSPGATTDELKAQAMQPATAHN